ncbi:MAG: hypothetical protein NTU79_01845 [Planctomycetota bacterium]|nr:hypothetical protein [Planctomycetota bacterium]
MGVEADTFLDALPVPAKVDEAKLLVATADGSVRFPSDQLLRFPQGSA